MPLNAPQSKQKHCSWLIILHTYCMLWKMRGNKVKYILCSSRAKSCNTSTSEWIWAHIVQNMSQRI